MSSKRWTRRTVFSAQLLRSSVPALLPHLAEQARGVRMNLHKAHSFARLPGVCVVRRLDVGSKWTIPWIWTAQRCVTSLKPRLWHHLKAPSISMQAFAKIRETFVRIE